MLHKDRIFVSLGVFVCLFVCTLVPKGDPDMEQALNNHQIEMKT